MNRRVKELVEAATVLSGAGDREGALRLVDEALRLAPEDPLARAFRQQLAPAPMPAAAATPFAPPPADLFGGPPKPSANPFVRADGGPSSPLGGEHDLEKLLLGASGALTPAASTTVPAGVATPPARQDTIPFGSQPTPTSSPTLHFGTEPTAPSADRPRSASSTVPFGTAPPAQAQPAGPHLPAAGEGAAPSPPSSEQPSRPPSSPGSARTGTMLSGGRASRPKTGAKPRPPSKKPQSASATPRPASSAPYDPMDLIDAPVASLQGEARLDETLKGARQLLEFADHSGALALVEQVLAESPLHAEALALKARCEATLTSMFESKLGNLARRPRLKLRPDEVIWLNLDHRAGFVLAQIDGQVTLEDLFDLSGMSRLDTARILAQLVEERVIQV